MTKNSTRKGLAIGAAAALSVAGLTASPAYALSIGTTPADGTSYVGIAGDTFNLAVSYSADMANFAMAKVKVTNPDGIGFTVTETVGGGNVAIAAADADGVFALTSNGATENIAISATDGPGDVTVQAWLDANGNGDVDAGELAGPVRTVSFLDAQDVTLNTSFVATPAINDTAVDLSFSFGSGVNMTQVDKTSFNATLTIAGADQITDVNANGNGTADEVQALGLALNAAKNAWVVEDLAITAVAGNNLYALQATYDDQNAVADVESALVSLRIAATDVTNIDIDTDATSNLRDDNGGAWSVRDEYTGNVVFTANVTDGTDGVAGAPVTVTISESGNSTLDADTTITSGGKSLTDADANAVDSISYDTTADANGVVTVTVKSNSGTATDEIEIDVVSKEDSNVVLATQTVTWTAEAIADYTTSIVSHTNDRVLAADGTAVTVKVALLDDFGALATDETRRINVTGGAAAVFANFSGGYATARVTLDGGNITITPETQDANGNWAQGALTAATLAWSDADAQFEVATIALAGGDVQTVDILGHDLATGDTATGATFDYVAADAEAGQLNIQVRDAAGNAVVTPVTLTASGNVAFSFDDRWYTTGSITVMSDAAGDVSVNMYSNVTGEDNITVTAGGVSETFDFDVNIPAANSEANVDLAVTGNEKGTTMVVTGSVTDKWGNPLAVALADFSLSYDGPGFIVGELPTSVAADGEIEFKVLLGQNDTIAGTVTVTTAGADADIDTAADNVTATLDIAPAEEPAADTKVNAGSFKGYVAVYAKGHQGKRLSAKIGNDWVVVESLASNFERVVDFTGAGYTISVRIYIDRVLTDTIVVTTK